MESGAFPKLFFFFFKLQNSVRHLSSSLFPLVAIISGQQQHFFDTRLTYHASRSAVAMAGSGVGGYPSPLAAANNWGYNNYTSYLGYHHSGATAAGVSPYQQAAANLASGHYGAAAGAASAILDPLLATANALPVPTDTTSSTGKMVSSIIAGENSLSDIRTKLVT